MLVYQRLKRGKYFSHRIKIFILFIIFIFFLNHPAYSQAWLSFQADAQRTGRTLVDFSSKDIINLWTFKPTERIWSYQQGSSVWSSSVCIANVEDKELVFVGFYHHNLYCLDARSGKIIWKFIAGGRLDFAPCFAVVEERPIVYIVSSDRTIYAIDAKTGKKLWSYETLKWSYTVSEAIGSSAVVVLINAIPTVIFSIWNNDYSLLNNLQAGELFALDARDGRKIYSTILSTSSLNSPAFTYIDGIPTIFITSTDGRVFSIDAREGRLIWQLTLSMGIYSSASINKENDNGQVFVGSRFGDLYALDAKNGRILWSKKFGHAIDSTPAILSINDKCFLYFGSYDRNIYALDAKTGEQIWRFRTGDYVAASCAIAKIEGRFVVFAHSLDNKLYCLDALNGSLLWSQDTGKLIWKYTTRGSTNWSSPAISTARGRPLLVFPSYDGNLYAFSTNQAK